MAFEGLLTTPQLISAQNGWETWLQSWESGTYCHHTLTVFLVQPYKN